MKRVLLPVVISLLFSFFLCSEAPKKVAVIGTGYVGSVVAASLASYNHTVICVGRNKEVIAKLKRGEMVLYEPGLAELIETTTHNNSLSFSDDPASAIRLSDILIIAVGTPMNDDGSANLTDLETVARTIGEHLNGYKIICIKSTVPCGTAKRVKALIQEHSRNVYDFDVVSMPDFLREGSAVEDCLHPSRIIIGSDSERPLPALTALYQPLHTQKVPFVFTTQESAEMIKYAANTFLATKITFINEIAALCEKVGADALEVARGMGLDSRIGAGFLAPGPGYGGGFEKDVEALLYCAQQVALELPLVHATKESNSTHKLRIVKKLADFLENDFALKKIAILGLSFKANTDDIRGSSSLHILPELIKKGALVTAYDPKAMASMQKVFPTELFPAVSYSNSCYDALKDAHALLILTEWEEFRSLDLARIKSLMKQPLLIDARNMFSTRLLTHYGFKFSNNGNATVV